MAAVLHSTGSAALRTLEPGEIARPFAPIPDLRAWLEARCETLADELQRLVGLLDTLDGDADLEADEDLEPSLCKWGAYSDCGDDREIDAAPCGEVV